MKHEDFMKLCAKKVAEYENNRTDLQEVNLNSDDVFTVWSAKTLQNSKCLMAAPHKGAYYYEFTLNGDKEEIYMDVYVKRENVVINDWRTEQINEKIKQIKR